MPTSPPARTAAPTDEDSASTALRPTARSWETDDLKVARVGITIFAVFALWRVTVGVDFGDGAHAVAQALRLADGDVPFVDEMNLQVHGAVLAVPFTWVWRHLVGMEGIVLASRVWYLILAAVAGWLAVRALRTRWPALIAIAAVAVALVPTPYNLLNVSYNTIPGLALLVAAAAGFAASETARPGWAVICGLCSALAVFSHPAVLPGAAATLVVVVVLAERRRQRPITRNVVASAAGLGLLALAWLTLVVGLGNVLRTFRYTTDYQSLRASPPTRLKGFVEDYADALLDWRYLPLFLLVVTAVVATRGLLAAGATILIPLAAAGPSVDLTLDNLAAPESVGATVGTYTTITVLALAAPILMWSRRSGQEPLNRLLLITVPAAAINLPVIAMATSAAPYWGATVAPLVPLLCVLVLGVLMMVRQLLPTRAAVRAAALSTLVVFAAVQSLYTFRNGTPWNATERVHAGPNAGLSTKPGFVNLEGGVRTVVAKHITDGDSALFYIFPAGYLASTAPMDTNIVWLGSFEHANQETVDWFERTDRHPSVAFIPQFTVNQAGGWDALVAQDPLIAYLRANYSEPVGDGYFYVLRRPTG